MGVHENLTGAQRAARFRAKKRAQGLRLKQIWVPDLRDPNVRERFSVDGASLAAQAGKWDDVLDDAEAFGDEALDPDQHPPAL
jgi:hypothetical protein